MSRRHHPKAGFWIRLCVAILYPFDALLFKLDFRHLDRIPATGGVVLAINHLSYVDTVVMARLTWQAGRIPRFLIKSDLFGVPGLGRIFRGADQITVYRGTADAGESLRDAAAALDRGQCVVIYPEGTITHDPGKWAMRARTGVARLALMRPDIPVVPVGQWGAHLALDTLRRRFRPFPRKPLVAQAGPPLDLRGYADRPENAELLREMTDVVMAAITAQVADARGETPPPDVFTLEHPPRSRRPRPRVRRSRR